MIYDIQKASLLKRFSAFLLDLILLVIIATGAGYLVSLASNYNHYYESVQQRMDELSKEYNVDLSLSQEEAEQQYSQADYSRFLEAYDRLVATAGKDYVTMLSLSVMIVSIGLLVGFVVIEFVVPLCLKNGQTLGKKVFKIGVMQINGIKLAPQALFVRSILGKYTVETMLPVLGVFLIIFGIAPFLGLVLVAGVLIAQILFLIINKNHCLIHDLLASTVAVDLSLQMIFDSEQDLVDYKEQIAKEKADKASY